MTTQNNVLLEDITLMLDSIFDTLRDMTSQDIEFHLSKNSEDAQIVRDYIEQAEESRYHPARLGFLRAIRDTYLE